MAYLGIAVFIAGVLFLFTTSSGANHAKGMRKGRSELIPPELYDFLEEADDAYILTHQTAEISSFSKYASNSVCNEVLEGIYKKPAKMFGTKNYRDRTWTVIDRQEDEIVLRKEIAHRSIKVKKGIRLTLGDHMIELWTVSLHSRGYLIEEVLEMQAWN
ncbi:hypothetical protein [Cohnella lupini]|nr:hypothetical protein [Cohnella lupini]